MRIPKGRVQRRVFLDHTALMWALNAIKDDRYNVTERGAMTDEWGAKYDAAEKHIAELIHATETS
jgi:hypothetical protein